MIKLTGIVRSCLRTNSKSLFPFALHFSKNRSRFAFPLNGQPALFSESLIRCQAFFSSNRNFFDPANKKRYRGILCFLTRIRYSVSSTFFSPDRHRCRLKNPDFDFQTVPANSFTAAARSVYAPFTTPCQQVFCFFLLSVHQNRLIHLFL